MRVTVRLDTSVSLSDFGSSVWGGSDEEGTVDSGRSKVSRASGRSAKTKSWASRSVSNSSSRSSGSYDTPLTFGDHAYQSSSRSMANSQHGPSPLSNSWGNAMCSRWVDRSKNKVDPNSTNGTSSKYGDALSRIDSLSLSASERADDYSDSEAESEGSAHTRGPQSNKMVVKRSAVALEDGTSIHHGVRCKSCHMSPIIGMRYHCASCVKGADFVSVAGSERCCGMKTDGNVL